MVLRQLRELVGEYRQAIIINGELLTINGRIIYCKKNKHSIVFVSKERNGEETEYNTPDIDVMIKEKIAKENYTAQQHNDHDITVSVCNATNVIVIATEAYKRLVALAKHPENNISDALNSELVKLMRNTVINYYEIYCKILRPKLSRMPVFIKAHLIHNLYLPIVLSSKEIPSPFEFALFRAYMLPLLERTKTLEVKSTKSVGFTIQVIAGCYLSDILGLPVYEYSPNTVMLALMNRLCLLFPKDNAQDEFHERYSREFSIVFPNSPDIAVTAQMQERQTQFLQIESTGIFKFD